MIVTTWGLNYDKNSCVKGMVLSLEQLEVVETSKMRIMGSFRMLGVSGLFLFVSLAS